MKQRIARAVFGWRYAPDWLLGWALRFGRLTVAGGHNTFTPVVNAFRFYDDGSESGSTPKAAQGTNVTIDVTSGNQKVHLRVRIDETGVADGATTDDYRLQVSKNGGAFNEISSASGCDGDANSSLTEGSATTNRATNGITDPGSGSFVAGEQSEDALIDDRQLTSGNFTEHVWALNLVAANLANGDTLDFRVTLNGGTPGMTNNVTPRITVQKSAAALFEAAVTLAITATAGLTTEIQMAGTASAAITATAALTTEIQMAAVVTAAVSTAGALTTEITMAGTSTAAVTTAGVFTTEITMVGTAALAIAAAADLEAPGQNLVGTATLAIAASAALTTEITMAGTAAAAVQSTAALSTEIALAGTASAAVATAGALTTDITMATAVALSVNGAGDLTAEIRMAAAAALAINAAGALDTAITMAGTAQLAIAAAGELTVPSATVLVAFASLTSTPKAVLTSAAAAPKTTIVSAAASLKTSFTSIDMKEGE